MRVFFFFKSKNSQQLFSLIFTTSVSLVGAGIYICFSPRPPPSPGYPVLCWSWREYVRSCDECKSVSVEPFSRTQTPERVMCPWASEPMCGMFGREFQSRGCRESGGHFHLTFLNGNNPHICTQSTNKTYVRSTCLSVYVANCACPVQSYFGSSDIR